MKALPPHFKRPRLRQPFYCPQCGYRTTRPVVERTRRRPFAFRQVRPRYWCEQCGGYARQFYPDTVALLRDLFVAVPILLRDFLPINDFVSGTGIPGWAAAIALSLQAFLLWPWISRPLYRYTPTRPPEATGSPGATQET